MKWRVYLSSVLVVFLSLCFGSFIINQKNNVSAVSDLTFVIDDSNYNTFNANCGNDCSFYHYVLISDISSTGFVYQISPYSSDSFIRLYIAHNVGFGSNMNFILFSVDNADQFKYIGANWSSGSSFKITLSENNPFGSTPSGSLSITENGTYDVTNYSQAVVDIPPEVVQGDYHDDLVSINNSILIVCAVGLVIYFFYAIYKMLLGGKTL